MEPFSLLIGWTMLMYAVGGLALDGIAVAKKQPLPSVQKARDRHERRLERGEQSTDPAHQGYLTRIAGNAAEWWAERSDHKHRARMEWLAEQGPNRSQKWLDRKRKRAAAYERAAQATADKAGVLWGKTKDAADAARERRLERQAWERNRTEPAPEPDPSPDTPDRSTTPVGTVLEFRRNRRTAPDDTDADPVEVIPTGKTNDEGGTSPSTITGDPRDPSTWRGTDSAGRDIHTGRGAGATWPDGTSIVHDDDTYLPWSELSPERRIVLQQQYDTPAGNDETTEETRNTWRLGIARTGGELHQRRYAWREVHQHNPLEFGVDWLNAEHCPYGDDHVMGAVSTIRGGTVVRCCLTCGWGTAPETGYGKPVPNSLIPGTSNSGKSTFSETEDYSMSEHQSGATPAGTGTATATGEITNLQDAITYTRTMITRLFSIVAQTAEMRTDSEALARTAQAAAQEVDQAIASLRGAGVEGQHVTALASAGEDLSQIASAASQAATAMNTVSESASTAQGGFTTAHKAFQAQTGLEEEIQNAQASGNRAGQRQFYENA